MLCCQFQPVILSLQTAVAMVPISGMTSVRVWTKGESFITCMFRTVFEEIGEGADIHKINGRDMPMRQYCGLFNFASSDQQVTKRCEGKCACVHI